MERLPGAGRRVAAWWRDANQQARFVAVAASIAVLFAIATAFLPENPTSPRSDSGATSPEPVSYFDEYGGSPSVYSRIESMRDCGSLQDEFDRAAANNDRAEPGSAEHRWTLGYMRASDDRLEAVGCYN